MIKVLGLDNISKTMSIAKNKMNLAERRTTMKVGVWAAEEAGGKNQGDAITTPVGSFQKFPGAGGVRQCRAEDWGLRKKKLKLLDAANSGF